MRMPLIVLVGLASAMTDGTAPLRAQTRAAMLGVAEIVDSAALASRISELRPRMPLDTGVALFWVAYPDKAEKPFVHAFHATMAPAAADSIGKIVLSTIARGGGGGGTVLQVTIGDSATFAARKATGARPSLLNGLELAERLMAVGKHSERLGNGVVRIKVSPLGRPDSVWISHSSGSSQLDRAMVEIGRMARFHPGNIEGYPVPMWIDQPLQFRYD